MSEPNLAVAFGLPAERAVEFFRSRGLQVAGDWKQVASATRAGAFSVAAVLKADVLQDIRGAMDKAIAEGQTYADFKRNLRPLLASKGYLTKVAADPDTGEVLPGRGMRPWHLDTVFRTNTQSSYMAGRYKAMVENADERPEWEYVAVMDSRTRQRHRQLYRRRFRWDDPIWRYIYPPNGYRCRCRVSAHRASNPSQLSSSAGRLETVEVDLGPRGGRVSVTRYRDPTTGELLGPDPGFDHPPGPWGRDVALARGVQALPSRELRTQAWQALNSAPQRQAVVRDFVDDVLARQAAGRPVGGLSAETLGVVDEQLADLARQQAPELQPARLAVLEEQQLVRNAGAADALTREQYAALPGLLAKPDAVLWDRERHALVLVRWLARGDAIVLPLPSGRIDAAVDARRVAAAQLRDVARYIEMERPR